MMGGTRIRTCWQCTCVKSKLEVKVFVSQRAVRTASNREEFSKCGERPLLSSMLALSSVSLVSA